MDRAAVRLIVVARFSGNHIRYCANKTEFNYSLFTIRKTRWAANDVQKANFADAVQIIVYGHRIVSV